MYHISMFDPDGSSCTRVQSIPPPRPLTAYKATSSTLCYMEIWGGGGSCAAGDPWLLVFEPVKLAARAAVVKNAKKGRLRLLR